jgi:hypothetical protein
MERRNLISAGHEAEARRLCLEMSAWDACIRRDKKILKMVLRSMGKKMASAFMRQAFAPVQSNR